MTEATHKLMGAPVTALREASAPWDSDAAPWRTATRLDTGETVTAPLSYFVPVCDGRETPVNDSQTLTHDMVMRAIRTDDPHEAARLMRSYADEADRVGATALAARLREYAANRVLNAEPDLNAIDRSIDSVLAFWPERERRSRSGSCLVALETLYPDVSRVVLAERIASAQLARSIAPSLSVYTLCDGSTHLSPIIRVTAASHEDTGNATVLRGVETITAPGGAQVHAGAFALAQEMAWACGQDARANGGTLAFSHDWRVVSVTPNGGA